jgi:4a-hydroxytetrahydrobiopterin dehydratase
MRDLAEQTCEPCRGGVPPLSPAQREPLLAQLDPGWKIVDGHHLSRSYSFANFVDGLAFVNRVAEVAEEQGHHPDLLLRWGEVRVDVWTHKINGLHQADFVLAAKCDRIRSEL